MRDDPTVVALVGAARDGSKAAWDRLVERYAPLVWSICRRFQLSDTDIDDVGQTVWLRLVERLPSLREPAALPGWLVTTTRRECLSVVRATRQRERQESQIETEPWAGDAVIEQGLLDDELDAALRDAFADLPPRCQDLLSYLVRDPPLTYAEIAARLHMPIGGVGPNRDRCLKKLRHSPALAAFIDSTGRGERLRSHTGSGRDVLTGRVSG
jgi:RNA polymerase sigma factor (sigma-70 family)